MDFAALLGVADQAARAVLGQDVVYTNGATISVTVRGIFDALYIRVDNGEAGLSSSSPAVFLNLADLNSDPESDQAATVLIDGTNYKIREVQKDGTGRCVLILRLF